MIRGKYLRERKAIRVKRRFKLLVSMLILFLLYKIVFSSFSLYESEANSDADADVAYFVLNDEYQSQVIKLDSMNPGDTQDFVFNISNYVLNDDSEEVVSEVDMEYTLKIRTTTNLPLEYELTRSQSAGGEETFELVTDDDGTYFKKLLEETGTFSCDQGYTNTYTLTITFPTNENDIKYQDLIECIEVSVDSRQII